MAGIHSGRIDDKDHLRHRADFQFLLQHFDDFVWRADVRRPVGAAALFTQLANRRHGQTLVRGYSSNQAPIFRGSHNPGVVDLHVPVHMRFALVPGFGVGRGQMANM